MSIPYLKDFLVRAISSQSILVWFKKKQFQRTYVETSGTRQCNCRMEMRQKRMGMGQFSIYQEKVCEKCPNVKLVSRDEELEIEIEKGKFSKENFFWSF